MGFKWAEHSLTAGLLDEADEAGLKRLADEDLHEDVERLHQRVLLQAETHMYVVYNKHVHTH